MLLDTFLVRTILVPSIIIKLGKWSFWPRKLHDRNEEKRKDNVAE
ncbi:hypothetical protein [Alteribacter populi]